MKLLIACEWFPYPPIVGAKLRTLNVIRRLARIAKIDVITLVRTLNERQVAEGKEYLRQFCHSVEAISAIPYDPGQTNLVERFLDPVPVAIRKTRNPEFEASLSQVWQSGKYQAAISCQCGGAPTLTTITAVRAGIRPLIIDELSYFHEQNSHLGKRIFKALQWQKYRRYSRSILRHVDAFTTVSERDLDLFRALAPPTIISAVIENALEIGDYQAQTGQRQSETLIFTGPLSYQANYQAMAWFTRHVWNQLQQNDHRKLLITGDVNGIDTESLRQACPQIEFSGLIADIKPLLAQSRIALAPLWSGGGTRLKILEALALGTPVISTPFGAEGLQTTHLQDILLANSAAEFAKWIERLTSDDELWQRLSENGKKLVEQHYNANLIETKYGQIFESLGLG
jgi:glycosyltransferase involved in cell wall biosynthesis